MPNPFYILAVILIYFSLKSFRGGIEYLSFFKNELAKPMNGFAPFTTVIAPCKGLDDGLLENLNAITEQEYPNYEIIFVVDDENDPAVGLIQRLMSGEDTRSQSDAPDHSRVRVSERLLASSSLRGRIPARLIAAPKAIRSSQKVENLREAVLHTDPRSEVFVFVDSDVHPAKDWLRRLVAPLEDENVGAATGYRWFVSKRMTLGGELRSAWNASIASALGPNVKGNFCWGGSTAIRRAVFDRIRMRERWHGTLSDDFAVTGAVHEAGLEIRFVPGALTRSPGACTLRECFEFTTRQMKITRVYMPHLWLMSFIGSGLFTVVMLSAFLIVLLSRQNSTLVWSALAALAIVTVFSVGKAWLRLKAVRLVIPEAEKQWLPQLTLWLATPPIFLYNCIAALVSRRVRWRGITYKLVSEKETLRIR